jgi:hypothetical protein
MGSGQARGSLGEVLPFARSLGFLVAKKKGGNRMDRLPALREASALNNSQGSKSSGGEHIDAAMR